MEEKTYVKSEVTATPGFSESRQSYVNKHCLFSVKRGYQVQLLYTINSTSYFTI